MKKSLKSIIAEVRSTAAWRAFDDAHNHIASNDVIPSDERRHFANSLFAGFDLPARFLPQFSFAYRKEYKRVIGWWRDPEQEIVYPAGERPAAVRGATKIRNRRG